MLRGQRIEAWGQTQDRHERREAEVPQGRGPGPGAPATEGPEENPTSKACVLS